MKVFQSKHIIFILGITLLLFSCSRRPKETLSSSEMTKVLVDIHIADGIFETNEYRSMPDEDKINYYNSILAKHNITVAKFDSSLVWYSSDPKRLEKIYNKVIAELNTYEEDVKSGKYGSPEAVVTIAETDIWNQADNFNYTNNKSRNRIYFNIKDTSLIYGDNYLLTFRQRIQPENSCTNQRTIFYTHYSDGKTDSMYKNLHTDGKLRKYTLSISASHQEKIDSLSGYILLSDSCTDILQSVYIDSISLKRIYNPAEQEIIRQEIENNRNLNNSQLILFRKNIHHLVL